jgi:hypothetical protein
MYRAVQKPLSSGLLPKNVKFKLHKTIILPVVLYGCRAESPTITGRMQVEDVWEKGAAGNVWSWEEGSDKRLEEFAR